MQGSVQISMGDAHRRLVQLNIDLRNVPKGLMRAYVMTLNEGIDAAKSSASSKLVGRYHRVTRTKVNKVTQVSKASIRNPIAKIKASQNRGLHLSDYKTGSTKRGGVRASVLEGRELVFLHRAYEGRTYKAFFGKGKSSGKKIVFTRDPELPKVRGKDGYKREGIRAIYGPSFLGYLNRPNVKKEVANTAVKRFDDRFVHISTQIVNRVIGSRR